jgi:hypothetical protein
VSDNIAALEWIRESIPEYELMITFSLPNYKGWVDDVASTNSYLYRYSTTAIEYQGVNHEAKIMSDLTRSWLYCYSTIANAVNHQRRFIGASDNFKFQPAIYQEKLKEARDILAGNLSDIKFLKLESMHKEISLENLAQEVILQHDISMGFLARTEVLRVKWLDKLKQSNDIDQHADIIKEFKRELHEYHRLS